MRTASHKSRTVLAAAGAAVVVSLTACSGGDPGATSGSSSTTETTPTAVPSVSSLKDIPGLVMLDKQWATYSTAQITATSLDSSGTGIDVNYVAGPDECSGFAGYAAQRDGSTVEVTIVAGTDKGCTGKGTTRTTVLPVAPDSAVTDVRVSAYSQQVIPIS